MKYISISLFILLILVSYSNTFSQPKSVQIGETCPDVELQHLINFNTDHIKISDLKGKLVILDFWATWCAPCVSMIPVTDSLQKEFEGQIQILSVTDQDEATVSKFLKTMKVYKNISMPSVTGDRVLGTLFPHVEIPHYVWLDRDSKVIAITTATEVNAETIKNFLNNKAVSLPVKKDEFKNLDDSKPMFVTGMEVVEDSGTHLKKTSNTDLLFHSVISRYISGLGCEVQMGEDRITCKNSPVGDLYRVAAAHYNLINFQFNSTIWETSNPRVKMLTDSASTVYSRTRADIDNWMNVNTFCYELQYPSESKNQKFDLMLQDLNNYFGAVYNITGGIEKRKTKCLVLIKISKSSIFNPFPAMHQSSVDQYHLKLKQGSIKELLGLLSINLDTQPPLVDETHDSSKVDIDVSCNMADLNSVNNALATYGFRLIEKVVDRDMIVIKDKTTIKRAIVVTN